MILKHGLIQVYSGGGKGKTTAALGLAWRMLGNGGRVYVCQFLKPADQYTGEAKLAEEVGERLCWDRLDVKWDMLSSENDPEQMRLMTGAVNEKLKLIKESAAAGDYDLMILDEIIVCLKLGIDCREELYAILDARAEHVEVVLTGRGADEALIERADLVTEMQEVKHPFARGIAARRGIEF
ncbi:MAG: cob(I)yrinic acid a,c-diamide adenosyltransferase [Planctomycetes bacterium]|nr:cob(I)yrinic acid a,c-diamide adenosyltransferase [Planctomycetota bacterium]